jgi:hypothetical protein
MHEGQTPALVLDLIEMMQPVLPTMGGMDLGAILVGDLLDHLFKETQDTMLRHIQFAIDGRGLDHRRGRGVEFKDGSR